MRTLYWVQKTLIPQVSIINQQIAFDHFVVMYLPLLHNINNMI